MQVLPTPKEMDAAVSVGAATLGQVHLNAQQRRKEQGAMTDNSKTNEIGQTIRSQQQELLVRGSSSEFESKSSGSTVKRERRIHGKENAPVGSGEHGASTPANEATRGFKPQGPELQRRPVSARSVGKHGQGVSNRVATKPVDANQESRSTSSASRESSQKSLSCHADSEKRGGAVPSLRIAGFSRPTGVSKRYDTVQAPTRKGGVWQEERDDGSNRHLAVECQRASSPVHHEKKSVAQRSSADVDLAHSVRSRRGGGGALEVGEEQRLLQEEEELLQLEAKLERDRSALKQKKQRMKLERMEQELRLEGEKALLEFEDEMQGDLEGQILEMIQDKESRVGECRRLQAELHQHISRLQAMHADLSARADAHEKCYAASVEKLKELHADAIAEKKSVIQERIAQQLEAEKAKLTN